MPLWSRFLWFAKEYYYYYYYYYYWNDKEEEDDSTGEEIMDGSRKVQVWERNGSTIAGGGGNCMEHRVLKKKMYLIRKIVGNYVMHNIICLLFFVLFLFL